MWGHCIQYLCKRVINFDVEKWKPHCNKLMSELLYIKFSVTQIKSERIKQCVKPVSRIYSEPGGRGGGCSPEMWRPIREGENTLLGLFFVKNARNVRTRLGGQNDLKPPMRGIFIERNVLKYRIMGHFFNVHLMASKNGPFLK